MSRTFQKIYDALGNAYKCLVDRDENGIDTQVVEISNPDDLTTISTTKFPEVPGAVSCEISGLSGSAITKVYKDVSDATLATLTITFVSDDEITQVWT